MSIDGINGIFQPDGALTRAQLCKILATIPEDLEAAAPTESDDAAETETEGESEAEGEAESEGETEGEEESKAA